MFEQGKVGNKVISKLTISPALIVMETRSNTSDSKPFNAGTFPMGCCEVWYELQPRLESKDTHTSAI